MKSEERRVKNPMEVKSEERRVKNPKEVKSEELKIGGRRESQQKGEESISLYGYLILHSSLFTLHLNSSLFT